MYVCPNSFKTVITPYCILRLQNICIDVTMVDHIHYWSWLTCLDVSCHCDINYPNCTASVGIYWLGNTSIRLTLTVAVTLSYAHGINQYPTIVVAMDFAHALVSHLLLLWILHVLLFHPCCCYGLCICPCFTLVVAMDFTHALVSPLLLLWILHMLLFHPFCCYGFCTCYCFTLVIAMGFAHDFVSPLLLLWVVTWFWSQCHYCCCYGFHFVSLLQFFWVLHMWHSSWNIMLCYI